MEVLHYSGRLLQSTQDFGLPLEKLFSSLMALSVPISHRRWVAEDSGHHLLLIEEPIPPLLVKIWPPTGLSAAEPGIRQAGSKQAGIRGRLFHKCTLLMSISSNTLLARRSSKIELPNTGKRTTRLKQRRNHRQEDNTGD